MSEKVSKEAYEAMIAVDVSWLESHTEDCLEQDHTLSVLKHSVSMYYPQPPKVEPTEPETIQRYEVGPTGVVYLRLDGSLCLWSKVQAEIARFTAENKAQGEELERYKAALEKLARLGNEPMLGNSDGNKIAQEALKPPKGKQDGSS